MKKILALFVLLLMISINLKAQSITKDEEWDKLIGYLSAEQWDGANSLSLQFLKRIPDADKDGDEAAGLRYMYILSEAGLMNEQKVTKNEAQKKVAAFAGRRVILAGHPLTSKEGFNSIQLVNDKTDTLMVTASNIKATQIFSFEYIIPKKAMPLDEFKNNAGKVYGVSGRIKSIKVEGTMFPRFKIYIDEAELSQR
ncbi:hypothetical protein EWM62_16235 [Mucilaginibacter terrigena]|uniref:Uncharacterized protein n=1 Tax=Mucilaginibacter terrigena TaxID=2492395 RepID=A0A4Q5LHS9_9SPHI|nr:hypothetical protein [Mucilaginibacter terrigena]RYU87261.1 hypothetical protein EWM62_16235 [Mucilaginibacter terrigena]